MTKSKIMMERKKTRHVCRLVYPTIFKNINSEYYKLLNIGIKITNYLKINNFTTI